MSNITTSPDRVLDDVRQLLDARRIDEALALIDRTARKDPPLLNARAVSLLRAGRPDQALALLRDLVFPKGIGQVDPATPSVYLVNYATALLLDGNTLVAREILDQVPDQRHPGLLRLRDALARWKRSLPLFRRLLAACGFYPDTPVPIDFPPGDL